MANIVVESNVSPKGVPKHLRINSHREAIERSSLKVKLLEPALSANLEEIQKARPKPAKVFCGITDEDLSWLGFWMVLSKE